MAVAWCCSVDMKWMGGWYSGQCVVSLLTHWAPDMCMYMVLQLLTLFACESSIAGFTPQAVNC